MATYKSLAEMSDKQREWLDMCRQAFKRAPETASDDVAVPGDKVHASAEVTPGDTVNVRLRSKDADTLLCIARFRKDGQLQTFLDKSKEPWEEFLFPQPG